MNLSVLFLSKRLLTNYFCSQQEVAPGQPKQDPVGRPLVHKSAYKQTTGEAIYIDDMPSIAGELQKHLVVIPRIASNIPFLSNL